MTKSELVKRIAKKRPHLYLKDIERLVDVIFERISISLTREERVELRGFGAFSVRKRKPRVARNPKNNKLVELDERLVPYFRAGKELRERVNQDSQA